MKRVVLALGLCMLLMLCGCVSREEKEKADEYAKQYSSAFINKVKEDFGENASVANITGAFRQYNDAVLPKFTIKASGDLNGKIVIDGNSYDAVYRPESDTLISNVYIDDIKSSLFDLLPFDKSMITYVNFTDTAYETPKFESNVRNIDEAMQSGYNVIMNVTTTEDLSKYKEDSFEKLEKLSELCDSSGFSVKVYSLYGSYYLSKLKGKINTINIGDSNTHPRIYSSEERTYVDIFYYFNLNSCMEIASSKNGLKRVYLD